MRSNGGTLNGQLSRVLSELGHTDTLVISDAGLPIPPTVERVDLALRQGLPRFLDVLDTVLNEIYVEGIVLSEEIKIQSPQMLNDILQRFPKITPTYVSHAELKVSSSQARAVVRSGEFTSYANIILRSGVIY